MDSVTLVEFDQTLKTRTINLCCDALDWHIGNCKAADYAPETMAEIELLHKLGAEEKAARYVEWFEKTIEDDISVDEAWPVKYREEINLLKTCKQELKSLAEKLNLKITK